MDDLGQAFLPVFHRFRVHLTQQKLNLIGKRHMTTNPSNPLD
jgi:hypothetical protein